MATRRKPIPIRISESEIQWCEALGKRRHYSIEKHSANWFDGKPPWFKEKIGVLGEKAYSIYSGYPVDDWTIGCGDDGTDFPNGAQAKGACQPRTPRLMLPVSSYNKKPFKFYVLGWCRPGDYGDWRLLGKISRERFDKIKQKSFFRCWTYWCWAKDLEPLESQESFRFDAAPRSFSY